MGDGSIFALLELASPPLDGDPADVLVDNEGFFLNEGSFCLGLDEKNDASEDAVFIATDPFALDKLMLNSFLTTGFAVVDEDEATATRLAGGFAAAEVASSLRFLEEAVLSGAANMRYISVTLTI